jgi:lipoic acid synthetase
MREAGVKEKGQAKTISIVPVGAPLPKPAWIRVRAPSPNSRFYEIKRILREQRLHTVCEEASCPNIAECFGKGTATFMILGDICTRRCPFCDVAHGRPLAPDAEEPRHLAATIAALGLRYVVITSVDRDDLRDGGAQHFVECIRAVRAASPKTTIEVLVPDFRGRLDRALGILAAAPPDVMNHNLETVPRLYKRARPGGDYKHSLTLLQRFKALYPAVPTSPRAAGLPASRRDCSTACRYRSRTSSSPRAGRRCAARRRSMQRARGTTMRQRRRVCVSTAPYSLEKRRRPNSDGKA